MIYMNKDKILPVILCEVKVQDYGLYLEKVSKTILSVLANENNSLMQKTIKRIRN